MSDPSPVTTTLGWDFCQRPLLAYAALRAEGRVHHVELPTGLDAWLVTDYALGEQLLADGRLRKSYETRAQLLARHGADRSGVGRIAALHTHLLASDPPDHTRLRALVSRAFTARRVLQLRPQVERRVAALLDDLTPGVELDLLDGLAFPLALGVLGDLLGVPEADLPALRRWVDALYTGSLDAGRRSETAGQFLDYLRQLLDQQRSSPGDGLVPELVRARDGEGRLSEDELLAVMGLLVTAGFETTAHLIGDGVFALLQHPDQLDLLRADPSLVPDAVEELLRLCSPVHLSTPRFSAEAVPCGEVTIPAGEIVLVSLLAADHDPNRYEAPDTLDVTRSRTQHLAFGHGVHYCLGAPLARLQTEVALRGLLDRFDVMTLAHEPDSLRWRSSIVVSGLETLPVRLGVASTA